MNGIGDRIVVKGEPMEDGSFSISSVESGIAWEIRNSIFMH